MTPPHTSSHKANSPWGKFLNTDFSTKLLLLAFSAVVIPVTGWVITSVWANNNFRVHHSEETMVLTKAMDSLSGELRELRELYHTLPPTEWRTKILDVEKSVSMLKDTNATEHTQIMVSQSEMKTLQGVIRQAQTEMTQQLKEIAAEVRKQ